jgi:RNA polymerase sigma-70 factor, ECF subfamily
MSEETHTGTGREEVSWDSVLPKYGSALLLYARQWAASHADAEEAVQNGILRLWRSRGGHGAVPVPLMFAAVKRSAIDLARRHSRRERREQKVWESGDGGITWFEYTLETQERQKEIEAAIHALPEEQREVLVMKIWGEMTFHEIAESLAIPANTAASRYRYALQRLRGVLAEELVHGQ